MVPAAIEELKKNMKGNRITPLVMVYKHKQDGAEVLLPLSNARAMSGTDAAHLATRATASQPAACKR